MQTLSHLFTFLSADMRENRTWKKDEQSAKPLSLLLKVEALDRQYRHHLGGCWRYRISGFTQDLPNQNVIFTWSPGAPLTHASLRSTCPYYDMTEDEADRGIFPWSRKAAKGFTTSPGRWVLKQRVPYLVCCGVNSMQFSFRSFPTHKPSRVFANSELKLPCQFLPLINTGSDVPQILSQSSETRTGRPDEQQLEHRLLDPYELPSGCGTSHKSACKATKGYKNVK